MRDSLVDGTGAALAKRRHTAVGSRAPVRARAGRQPCWHHRNASTSADWPVCLGIILFSVASVVASIAPAPLPAAVAGESNGALGHGNQDQGRYARDSSPKDDMDLSSSAQILRNIFSGSPYHNASELSPGMAVQCTAQLSCQTLKLPTLTTITQHLPFKTIDVCYALSCMYCGIHGTISWLFSPSCRTVREIFREFCSEKHVIGDYSAGGIKPYEIVHRMDSQLSSLIEQVKWDEMRLRVCNQTYVDNLHIQTQLSGNVEVSSILTFLKLLQTTIQTLLKQQEVTSSLWKLATKLDATLAAERSLEIGEFPSVYEPLAAMMCQAVVPMSSRQVLASWERPCYDLLLLLSQRYIMPNTTREWLSTLVEDSCKAFFGAGEKPVLVTDYAEKITYKIQKKCPKGLKKSGTKYIPFPTAPTQHPPRIAGPANTTQSNVNNKLPMLSTEAYRAALQGATSLLRRVYAPLESTSTGLSTQQVQLCTAGFVCTAHIFRRRLERVAEMTHYKMLRICSELVCVRCTLATLSSNHELNQCITLNNIKHMMCRFPHEPSWINGQSLDMVSPAGLVGLKEKLDGFIASLQSRSVTDTHLSKFSHCVVHANGTNTIASTIDYLTIFSTFTADLLAAHQFLSMLHQQVVELDAVISNTMGIARSERASLYVPLAGIVCQAARQDLSHRSSTSKWQVPCHELLELLKLKAIVNASNSFIYDWLKGIADRTCSDLNIQSDSNPAQFNYVLQLDQQQFNTIKGTCQSSGHHTINTLPANEYKRLFCVHNRCPCHTANSTIVPFLDRSLTFVTYIQKDLCSAVPDCPVDTGQPGNMVYGRGYSNKQWNCQLDCHYNPQWCSSAVTKTMIAGKAMAQVASVLVVLFTVIMTFQRYWQDKQITSIRLIAITNTIVGLQSILGLISLAAGTIGCRDDHTNARGFLDFRGMCGFTAVVDLLSMSALLGALPGICEVLWVHAAYLTHSRNKTHCAEMKLVTIRHPLLTYLVFVAVFVTPAIAALVVMAQGLRGHGDLSTCLGISYSSSNGITFMAVIFVTSFLVATAGLQRTLRLLSCKKGQYSGFDKATRKLFLPITYVFLLMLLLIFQLGRIYAYQRYADMRDTGKHIDKVNSYVQCHATHCDTSQCLSAPALQVRCWAKGVAMEMGETVIGIIMMLVPYLQTITHNYRQLCAKRHGLIVGKQREQPVEQGVLHFDITDFQ
eukprot:scpid19294/ scgid9327/ 